MAKKDDILITDDEYLRRKLWMNEDQGFLEITEVTDPGNRPWDSMKMSPEEVAQILCSCSGQFLDKFNAEVERIRAGFSQENGPSD